LFVIIYSRRIKNRKWGSKVSTLPAQEFHNIEDLCVEQLDTLKNVNIIGCDPGKRSLVYLMDSNGNKLQYTAKRKKSMLLNSKSVDYEKFKLYLVEKDKLNKETSEFYRRDVWR
jgi:hypothetical protein